MLIKRVKINERLYHIKSKFGWIISGKTDINETASQENTMFVMTHTSSQTQPELQHFSSTEESLSVPPDIDEFWKLETIDVILPEDKKKDKAMMDHFKGIVKKEDGRYQVAWPWKDENYKLL